MTNFLSPADLAAKVVPLSVVRWFVPREVTHVFYHSFFEDGAPHLTPLFGCKRPDDLERDLSYLKSRLRCVSHDELVAHLEEGTPLPRNAATVSFDDGLAECFTVARPLLLAHEIPATFFVCSNFIDNRSLMYRNRVALCISRLQGAGPEERRALVRALGTTFEIPGDSESDALEWLLRLGFADRETIDAACACFGIDVTAFLRDRRPYMTREQIGQLHADGFTIGAHTSDHPVLGRVADWNEVRRQVSESCDVARAITGSARVPFAFPFNGLDLPRNALAKLRDELGTIDLMYDTNNLMRDRPFIVNRIWCDTPAGATTDRSNLPSLLWRAHVFEPLRAIKRRVRRLPRS
jgi:peptidoglycan/xylan/chitin deacetylase (PgdA/CDA1 family)